METLVSIGIPIAGSIVWGSSPCHHLYVKHENTASKKLSTLMNFTRLQHPNNIVVAIWASRWNHRLWACLGFGMMDAVTFTVMTICVLQSNGCLISNTHCLAQPFVLSLIWYRTWLKRSTKIIIFKIVEGNGVIFTISVHWCIVVQFYGLTSVYLQAHCSLQMYT